ncbi:VOC family protein [Paenibacillus tarimensis]
MKRAVKKVNQENYQPRYAPKAFKVIAGHAGKSSDLSDEPSSRITNGLESGVDLMTLVQLPAKRLKQTVKFYVEILGLQLSYPERPIENNSFLQTIPRIGPGLHILETPNSEFRQLHGTVNGQPEEYVAFYAASLFQLHERLLQAGTEIVMKPTEGYMSFFDPEGHLIGIYERADVEQSEQFDSNITGFRHVQMHAADPIITAEFFEKALGFEKSMADKDGVYLSVSSGEINQPMIRLVQAEDIANPQPMHWILDGSPKHALELHSKNIGALKERILEHGGTVKESLEFTGCGGYLKFYTPDGHYIWVNQDRNYCNY